MNLLPDGGGDGVGGDDVGGASVGTETTPSPSAFHAMAILDSSFLLPVRTYKVGSVALGRS